MKTMAIAVNIINNNNKKAKLKKKKKIREMAKIKRQKLAQWENFEKTCFTYFINRFVCSHFSFSFFYHSSAYFFVRSSFFLIPIQFYSW